MWTPLMPEQHAALTVVCFVSKSDLRFPFYAALQFDTKPNSNIWTKSYNNANLPFGTILTNTSCKRHSNHVKMEYCAVFSFCHQFDWTIVLPFQTISACLGKWVIIEQTYHPKVIKSALKKTIFMSKNLHLRRATGYCQKCCIIPRGIMWYNTV
jgi:hypothetical protein